VRWIPAFAGMTIKVQTWMITYCLTPKSVSARVFLVGFECNIFIAPHYFYCITPLT